MPNEDTFTHAGRTVTYERTTETTAVAIVPDGEGRTRRVHLDAQTGGGAYVSSTPAEYVAAVTALGFHLWPRENVQTGADDSIARANVRRGEST